MPWSYHASISSTASTFNKKTRPPIDSRRRHRSNSKNNMPVRVLLCRRPEIPCRYRSRKSQIRRQWTMSEYSENLRATKNRYPFTRWTETAPELYPQEVSASFAGVFDELIAKLIDAGNSASELEKLVAFREAVEALNEMEPGLIETGEREDLCELCNVIAIAAGLDPTKYGAGEGPASEWREW